MHHFIYPNKDTWISSGSNKITGEIETDQNYGKDQIIEIKKDFYNLSFNYPTRGLFQFNLNELSKSIVDKTISSSSAKYFLRLYEAEGNKELSTEYTLAALAISQSWDEGRGKSVNNPKVTDGASWTNRINKPNSNALTWSNAVGVSFHGASYISRSGNIASQSFSYESADVNMNITDIVNNWLTGSNASHYCNNNGLLLKYSGSQETDEETFGELKFFSADTHTIYSPRLEVRWDDHIAITGSITGSLLPLSMSGAHDHYLYMIGLRDAYKETEKIKFRVAGRDRYIQKNFSTSVQTITGSYISEDSGSYSIVDIATGETIVPFKDVEDISYTKLSCDSISNYFTQWLNGFETDRIYKILYKVTYQDGQEYIYDEDWEFKVTK